MPPTSRIPFRVALMLLAGALPTLAGAGSVPEFQREYDAIPLSDANGPIPGAWRGGIDKPRPQLVDADGDGDLDLFLGEELGKLRFYRNEGTPGAPDFVFETDEYEGLHERFFYRVHDVDRDGDQDVLVQAEIGAYLYTNTGTPAAPVWENRSERVDGLFARETGDPIFFPVTIPDFVDLDGDGDSDLLHGNADGTITLYRNVGTANAPVFRRETENYGEVFLVSGSCEGDPVPPGPARHGYMIFSFEDLDEDGDPDLFVGDEFLSNVRYVRNDGGSPDPDLVCVTEFFFADSTGSDGSFGLRLVPAFGDLDGDGDRDALLGSAISGKNNLTLFRNDAGALQWQTDSYLPELDLGFESAAAFADLDGDEDLDLLYGAGTPTRGIVLYENIGTPTAPAYRRVDPPLVSLPTGSWTVPETADIDDDGDLDLFIGFSTGAVRWWRNDEPGAWPPGLSEVTDDPDFGLGPGHTFDAAIEGQAVPRFFDEDDDGDLDLLAGSFRFLGNARLLYFRNDGSAKQPAFVLSSSDYQGLGSFDQASAPALGDLDGDGDLDLLVGNVTGRLAYLENTGQIGRPSFQLVAASLGGIDVGADVVPALADVDGDGDLDLATGESGGGLNFFRNTASCRPDAPVLTAPGDGLSVYGTKPMTFRWEEAEPSLVWEFRLAHSPDAPPETWKVWAGLTEPFLTITLRDHGFRWRRGVAWTVAASNACGTGPAAAWRQATIMTFPATTADAPDRFALTGIHPSPTRDTTRIEFTVPAPAHVRVVVYDPSGRRVAVVADGARNAGTHHVVWNGRSAGGAVAAAGVYLVRIESQSRIDARRLVRVR